MGSGDIVVAMASGALVYAAGVPAIPIAVMTVA
jgi:hypothetical protein